MRSHMPMRTRSNPGFRLFCCLDNPPGPKTPVCRGGACARLHRACPMQDTSDTRAQSRIAYVLINRYIYVLACVLRPHYTLGRPLSHSALDRFRSASCSHVNVRYETTRAAVYDTYQKTVFCEVGVERHRHGHERPSAHERARWLRNSTG